MEKSIFRDTYYVRKQSGTYADVFMAYGLARLLELLLLESTHDSLTTSVSVRIEDSGPYYLIRLSEPLREEMLDRINYPSSLAPFLSSKKDLESGEKPTPVDFPARDYDQTMDMVRSYNEQRRALKDQNIPGKDIQNQLIDLEPPPDWQIVRFLGDWHMQARDIYNRIVVQWVKVEPHWKEHLETILQIASTPNWDTEMLNKWRKIAKEDKIKHQETASQLLNPHQGKGQNESKAFALRMDNIKDRPWLEEYLKAAGLWYCLTPRQVTDNKDWKVYVLSPKSLGLVASREAFRKFNSYIWNERRGGTNLKVDITSILLFYKAWLDYIETQFPEEDTFDIELARPENVVAGFHTVQFKLLSQNAYTMVNQSFLRLPSWGSTLQSKSDVSRVVKMLDEHLDVIRGIEENHSDGYDLLRLYRDFVAGENWGAFFDFNAAYAQDAMRRMNSNDKYVPLFSVTHLRRLLMTQKKIAEILESEGFQNVAYAIRHSTIVPQGRKARGLEKLYDIHYGLGAELKRKSAVKEEFLAALADFMHSYNQENVQTLENTGKQMRKDLRTSDIQDVVRLIDEYGSEVVANLLISYGYAREPREEESSTSAL